MSNLVDLNPYGVYNDLQGRPLNNGKIYIGLPNQDPKQYPAQIFWDAALTIPAAQPLRTVGGYVARNGTPAKVYINGNYSLKVTDKNDSQIFYVQDYYLVGSASVATVGVLESGYTASIPDYSALRNFTAGNNSVYINGYGASYSSGIAGQFIYDPTDTTSSDNGGTIIVSTNGKRWKRLFQKDNGILPIWFGADPTGINESTTALQNCINFATSTGGVVNLGAGTKYRVNTLTISNTAGCSLLGKRSGHESAVGSTFIYMGTDSCIKVADGTGAFMYRTFLQDFQIIFEQNCASGIYAKNLQECTIQNVGVWAGTKTVNTAFDLDGIGIVNIDNNISSRCLNGFRMHFNTSPNPQASGGSSFTRNNIYFSTNSIVIGYTLGLVIEKNWIEGFSNGILISNSDFSSPRTEVSGLIIQDNWFIQSTTALSETRAVNISNSNNANPIRADISFVKNWCYMNSSGALTPQYAVSFDATTNSTTVDVNFVAQNNTFIGVSVAGILNNCNQTNSQRSIFVDRDNKTVTTLFSTTKLPNVIGNSPVLQSFYVLNNNVSAISSPSNTSENIISTVNIPAYLLGKTGRLKITALWSATNNANSKIIRIRMNDIAGTVASQVDMSSSNFSTVNVSINNRNATNLQYIDSYAVNSSGISGAGWRAAPSYETNNMVPLLFTVQKSTGTDSVVLESLLIEALPT